MKRLTYRLFTIILIFYFGNALGQAQKPAYIIDKTAKARIDSTLKSLVDEGSIAGVSALIFEKDKEVYFNAFGYADREAKIPMKRNTIVNIFSMTKPITGVALMKLYEKGAFQLDDPVSKYAPEFANTQVYAGLDASGKPRFEAQKRAMTIRDLTRHTSGLPYDTGISSLDSLIREKNPLNSENTLTQMAEKLGSLFLFAQPGEKWIYGVSVDVQALLVERISGKSYDEYLKSEIFEPLGMKETRYVVPQSDFKRWAASYRKDKDGKLTRVPDEEAHAFGSKKWALNPGGHGLTSTVDDYMRFARMLVNQGTLGNATLLKPETVKLMATDQLDESITNRMWLPSKGQVGFGIDFAVRVRPPASAEENNGVVGEFFWDGAASTLFWVDPVNELTAVLFVQIFPFDGKLHKKFRDAVYGAYRSKSN
ncbi:MAG: serine hydrolase domain-containing protein [Microscillaceae bacterium]|nr:serine hydrolase domain-containing protein [Microscillaceae bacterium]